MPSEPHSVSEPKTPAGYVCTKCGHRNKYPAMVYAHWRALYRHPCEKCGRKYQTIMGSSREAGGKRITAKAYYEEGE